MLQKGGCHVHAYSYGWNGEINQKLPWQMHSDHIKRKANRIICLNVIYDIHASRIPPLKLSQYFGNVANKWIWINMSALKISSKQFQMQLNGRIGGIYCEQSTR